MFFDDSADRAASAKLKFAVPGNGTDHAISECDTMLTVADATNAGAARQASAMLDPRTD